MRLSAIDARCRTRGYGTTTSFACGEVPWRCQASGTSSRPIRSIRTAISPRAACRRQLGVGGRLARLARRVVRVAEEVDRRRADRPRGQRRLRARGLAEADQRGRTASSRRWPPSRGSPHSGSSARSKPSPPGPRAGRGQVVRVVAQRHRRVGAEVARPLERLRVARGRHHAAGARAASRPGPRSGRPRRWPRARARVSPGCEPAAPLQPQPGREPGHAEAHRERGFESVRHGVAASRPRSASARAKAPNGLRVYSK